MFIIKNALMAVIEYIAYTLSALSLTFLLALLVHANKYWLERSAEKLIYKLKLLFQQCENYETLSYFPRTEEVVAHKHDCSKYEEIELTYNWIVSGFQHLTTEIYSPVFYADSHEDTQWQLAIKNERKFLSLYLHLISSNIPETKTTLTYRVRTGSNKYLRKVTKSAYLPRGDYISHKRYCSLKEALEGGGGQLSEGDIELKFKLRYVGYTTSKKSNAANNGQIKNYQCKLIENFEYLLNNDKFSDIKLTANEHEFPAHKAILSARSEIFADMFEKDKEINCITITDTNDGVFKEVLHYIYTGKCPKLEVMTGDIYHVAEKYKLEELAAMCRTTLRKNLSIETAALTLKLADQYKAQDLKQKTLNFIKIYAPKVVRSTGWQQMTVTESNLIAEVFEELAIKPEQMESV